MDMHVLYFCSDTFVQVAAVSIISLLENNKDIDNITIWIIDDGISEGKKNQLFAMIKPYGRFLKFIPAPDPSDFFHFRFQSRYQMGHSYMRMCVGSLLPNDVEKLLILDSDTLVCGNLKELWNIDLCNHILAGVADCVNVKAFKHRFLLDDDDIYCNAGMFLVNMKAWRANSIEQKICKTIQENKGNIFFFEQTLMNFACKGRILKIDAKYNSYTLFYAFKYKNLIRWRRPTNFYTEKEVTEAGNNPIIIHFTRNFYMTSRPWVVSCEHPLTSEYRKYMALCPWNDIEVDTRSNWQKFKYSLFHFIPQSLLVMIANVMYNTIRPLMHWKNE